MRDPAATATERLGRYQLLEPIGTGPSGLVSRAKVFGVAGFERQFAIKRFAPELTVLSSHAHALSAAARSYGSLEHPRIARMNEFGVAQGQTFTAVELVPGVDAMRLLAETKLLGNALATGGVLALISQAARAVGYAHGRGISHLGLAPTNLIVTPEGDVKVTDFGVLAATLPAKPVEAARLAKRIAYLAPEQLTGESVSAATDVFALGVLAYELIGGQPVFRGDSPRAIAEAILAGPPPDPLLPRPIVRVLQRCLARSPFERFPDARALADALDAALRVAPVPGTRRDIGAQVKAVQDRLAALQDSQLSGMLALDVGTGPTPRTELEPRDSQDHLDSATTEFVRPDTPVAGPAPLVGPGRAVPAGISPASTIPELPKAPVTVPGLAPPPIPVPPGVAPPPIPPLGPMTSQTILGVGQVKKPQAAPAIPRIVPRVPAAPAPSLAPPGLPARPPLPVKPPSPRGMTNLLDQLDEHTGGPLPADPHDAHTATGLPRLDTEGQAAVAANIAKGIEEEIAQDPRLETVMEPARPDSVPGAAAPPPAAPAQPAPRPTPPPVRVEPSTTEIPPMRLEELNRAASRPSSELADMLGQLEAPASVLAEDSIQPTIARPLGGELPAPVAAPMVRVAPEPAPEPEPERDHEPETVMRPVPAAAAERPIAPPAAVHAPPPIIGANLATRGRRRWPVVVLTVVLLGGLGGGGYYAWTRMESPSATVAVGKPVAARAGAASSGSATHASTAPAAHVETGSAAPAVAAGSAAPVPPPPAGSAAVAIRDAGVAIAAAPDAGAGAVKPASIAPTAPSDMLQITSTPSGARVFIDGADQGTTPLKIPGTADRHDLALFVPQHELYLAQIDGHGQFAVTLKPVTPLAGPAGIKVIRCKKERYYVYVDGQPTGMTCPTERIHVQMGPHTVETYDLVSEARQKWDIEVKETRLSFRVRVEN